MTSNRAMRDFCRLAIATPLVLLLGACASTGAVSGRVLPGDAGIATVVQANDPRLQESGVPGVQIRITDGSGGMGSIAEAVSKSDGSFSLRVPRDQMSERLQIHAAAEGIVPLHSAIFLPMDGRKLLVFVQPTGERESER